ncbi:OLC1v1038447C1 [Oldenlandia corymbosa var. corymbosa]|uniref:OLC1v1038447C1 n=1 Tax=Oldenlandia corymbosa var. corymbosa TaxID=529605 RepID=A0AAV1CZY3_OLDCO|nr:OLC1v1038447C1 [Oldenlandia corymbosa var. corymbosa]
MVNLNLLTVFISAITIILSSNSKCDAKCAFEAIFNFGDSNSDTGGFFAAFPPQPSPYGMTYFNKPVGRPSDGRLYLDFLAQALGLPFVSPYLQSIGSDYKHGANFATSASTVLMPPESLFVSGTSPFYLTVQLNQMKQFKAKVEEFHSSGRHTNNLPQPDIFGKSLYTIYIGQNDFTSNLTSLGLQGVKQYLPQVVSQIGNTIKQLYELGGRTFMVLNLAPIGCYPTFLVELPHGNTTSDIDAYGCLIPYNNAVDEYNKMLRETLRQLRKELVNANVVYFDSNSVLLDIFQHPKSHGMKYGTKACCGHGGGAYNFNPKVWCGYSNFINGEKITAKACNDPQNYVSWDGMHLTEAANKLLTNAVLNMNNNNGSSYLDPPSFSFHQFCDIRPITDC